MDVSRAYGSNYVRLHWRGNRAVESQPQLDVGSVFTVDLPLSTPAGASAALF